MTLGRGPGQRAGSAVWLALRLAARTSTRSLRQSALIVMLVALPIAALAGAMVVLDSTQPTTAETIRTELGQTQARLHPGSGRPVAQVPVDPTTLTADPVPGPDNGIRSPEDVLPAGTRILALSTAEVTASTATGVAQFEVVEGPSWDEAFSGRYDIIDGRAPRNTSEVMVTAALLPRLGAQIGSTIEMEEPAPAEVTIVGTIDSQTMTDADEVFFAPAGALSGTSEAERIDSTLFYLPDAQLTWGEVQALNKSGITALSRHVLMSIPEQITPFSFGDSAVILVPVSLGVAFAAFEVILLAGAAFTVIARQQQRTLATIASVGAPRRVLFTILTASGVVLGAMGGLVGISIGVAGAAVFMRLVSDGSATQFYGFHVPWLAVAGCVAFAAIIGWIASLLPARAASRFDVVSALRGGRKPSVLSRRRPVVGAVVLGVGISLTLVGGILFASLLDAGQGQVNPHPLLWVPVAMLFAGPVSTQIGLIACGPLLLLVVARSFSRAGVAARLAARDSARNPARAVPAMAATMTTMFVAVFAMCIVSAGQANTVRTHQYASAVGQVAVRLNIFDPDPREGSGWVRPYEHPVAIENALSKTLDIDEIRTLKGVLDAFQPTGTEIDLEHVATPTVAPANVCPAFPRSPEYDQHTVEQNSAEFALRMESDPRCRNHNYLWSSGATSAHIFVGDASDLTMVLDRAPSDSAQAALANGGAVSLYSAYVHNGETTISWWDPAEAGFYGSDTTEPSRAETLPAVYEEPEHQIWFGLFISPETADRLGLQYRNIQILASTNTAPTVAQIDALNRALAVLPDASTGEIQAHVETGPPAYAGPIVWGILALAGIIAIASAGVAIGLARTDGRQDEATLASIGAQPLIRRNFAFWQAAIVVGLGSILGASMGLIPAIALGANEDLAFTPPWLPIGITVVVVPMLISVGSWLLTRRSFATARRLAIA